MWASVIRLNETPWLARLTIVSGITGSILTQISGLLSVGGKPQMGRPPLQTAIWSANGLLLQIYDYNNDLNLI